MERFSYKVANHETNSRRKIKSVNDGKQFSSKNTSGSPLGLKARVMNNIGLAVSIH